MSFRHRITRSPWGLLIGLAFLALQGCSENSASPEIDEPAQNNSGVSLTVIPHTENTLMAVASVVSDSAGLAAIVFSSEETDERISQWVDIEANEPVEIVVVGMRALTEYSLKTVLDRGNGQEVESASVLHTTGSLPDNAPSVTLSQPATDNTEGGITLFGYGSGQRPNSTDPLYFGVDEEGEVVWYLHGTDIQHVDGVARGLENGNLLMFLFNSLAEITPAGEMVSTFDLDGHVFHHDARLLPNGNLLFLTTETQVINNDASPYNGENISYDVIYEINPETGATVWTWSTADHLDTARFPSALAARTTPQGGLDWTHANALYYSPAENTVLLSCRSQSWVIKIDRNTDEIVWIFGEGDQVVDPDFTPNFFTLNNGSFPTAQHAPTMTENGELLIFDNRNDSGGNNLKSRAVRYSLNEENFTASQVWEFIAPKYAERLGDVDELDNGNALVCTGGGNDQTAYLSEVAPDGELVWEIVVDDEVYRTERIAWGNFR